MAHSSSNITYRPVSTSQPSPTIDDEPNTAIPKPKLAININVSLSCPFNIPSTPKEAALRILRNLNNFKLYYVIFIWVVLLITLIPCRKLSLLFLLVSTNFGVMYLLLLRAFPSSALLQKWINKRFILAALAIATAVLMIVTKAGLHLLFTLVGTVPIILLHAVLQPNEGFCVTEATDVASGSILDV